MTLGRIVRGSVAHRSRPQARARDRALSPGERRLSPRRAALTATMGLWPIRYRVSMADEVDPPAEPARTGRLGPDVQVWKRLRAARESQGISLRRLAGQLDLSASALSHIETGRSRPSVSTLYGIVTQLGISMDELFADLPGAPARFERANGDRSAKGRPVKAQVVQRAARRRAIELESGVRWERLTPETENGLEFLFVRYSVGGSSGPGESFMSHGGRELGLVLSGRLRVALGFEAYDLDPGDSISFDSTVPHRLSTIGDEPAEAVWVVQDRGAQPGMGG
jgi:transcriptional regulator with XRE-family HTH domain